MENKVLSYFSFLQTKLWTNLQGLFFLSIIIAFISCIIVQAIKKADNTIFLKTELSKNFLFIINGIFNLIITIIVIIIFDGLNKWYFTGLYILLIFLFSYALSILCYDYFLKYIFKILDIINLYLNNKKKKLKGLKNDK
jgi:hypothetical protein